MAEEYILLHGNVDTREVDEVWRDHNIYPRVERMPCKRFAVATRLYANIDTAILVWIPKSEYFLIFNIHSNMFMTYLRSPNSCNILTDAKLLLNS